jgi:hypothetical protein
MLHSLVAVCVLTTAPVAIAMTRMQGTDPGHSLQFHKSLGVLILILMILRLINRLAVGALTAAPEIEPWQKTISSVVHTSLYVLFDRHADRGLRRQLDLWCTDALLRVELIKALLGYKFRAQKSRARHEAEGTEGVAANDGGGAHPCARDAFLQISRLCSSVANLDAGSIPNAPIAIPNRSASGPVTWRPYVVDGSRRYIDGGWLVVARSARYRRSKQCTNCQATNNAGGYLTTPCHRCPGCKCETKTACDQQTDQKLSHFVPSEWGTIGHTGLRRS